jgi:hypothetical protein
MSFLWFHGAHVKVATPKQTAVQLGQLEIIATHIEYKAIIEDNFAGPSRSFERIRVFVSIKNVGESPVCAKLIPTIEEYKGPELWRTDPIKPEYALVPGLRNLAAGKKVSGSYTFEPEPVKRKYVLVIEQKSASQSCGDVQKDKQTLVSTPRLVRIPLESLGQK